jgi:hypothetical protein
MEWTLINDAAAKTLVDDSAADNSAVFAANQVLKFTVEDDTLWASGTGNIGVIGVNCPGP